MACDGHCPRPEAATARLKGIDAFGRERAAERAQGRVEQLQLKTRYLQDHRRSIRPDPCKREAFFSRRFGTTSRSQHEVKPRTLHLPTFSSAQNTLTASIPLLWTIGTPGPKSEPSLGETEGTSELYLIVFDQ